MELAIAAPTHQDALFDGLAGWNRDGVAKPKKT
jgi:hypothetical protein